MSQRTWTDDEIIQLAKAAYNRFSGPEATHSIRMMEMYETLKAHGLHEEVSVVYGHPVPYSSTLWRGDHSLCYFGKGLTE